MDHLQIYLLQKILIFHRYVKLTESSPHWTPKGKPKDARLANLHVLGWGDGVFAHFGHTQPVHSSGWIRSGHRNQVQWGRPGQKWISWCWCWLPNPTIFKHTWLVQGYSFLNPRKLEDSNWPFFSSSWAVAQWSVFPGISWELRSCLSHWP
jgi:hypothetical protein